jgi:hypothetical protein
MHWFLLSRLGVEQKPADIQEAVSSYVDAQSQASRRLRTPVSDDLGSQVRGALHGHGLLA